MIKLYLQYVLLNSITTLDQRINTTTDAQTGKQSVHNECYKEEHIVCRWSLV